MFILYDNKMNKLNFPDGVKPLDIFISSIERNRITDSAEGSNVLQDMGYTYGTRNIELDILLKAYDTQDYRLLRDEVYALLDRVAYVSESHQKGKRYSVRIDSQYIPDRILNNQRFAEVKVECSVVGLPFAESIATTSLIDKNGLRYSDEVWQYGMGLLLDDESQSYTNTGTSFRIYNAGNVDIHPFEHELQIDLTGITGSGFEMKNITTGDTFKINDEMKPADKFTIGRGNMVYNNVNGLRKTNRKYISLASGWNEFRLNRPAKTSFNFRYYYK